MTSINDIYYGQNTTNVIFKKTWSPSTGLYPTDMTEGIMYIAEDDGTVGVENYVTDDAIFYKDTSWIRLGSADSGSPVAVSDTPPPAPEEGDLWWDSSVDNSGPLYTWNGTEWATSSGGTSIENWTPVPISVPIIGTIDVSGNTTITPNATGATFTNTANGGFPATSFSVDDVFEMSTVETGMYFKLSNMYDASSGGGGYNGFTDSTADWYTMGGALCGLYLDATGTGDFDGNLQISVGSYLEGTSEGDALNVTIPFASIQDKELCISVYHDNVDTITVNLYSEDTVNVPIHTFSYTLVSLSLQDAVDSITRSFSTVYQDTNTFSPTAIGTHYTVPTVVHSNVTLFSDVKVDPTSYPVVTENTQFRVNALAAPLYAEDIDVTLKNGYLTSFSAAGALETASPELTANEINAQLATFASTTGNNTFTGDNTFSGEFVDSKHLESNGTDTFDLDNHTKYLFKIRSNSTAATVNLPDISPSNNQLLPYVEITAVGKLGQVTIDDPLVSENFFINGVDSGASTYVITSGAKVLLVKGPTSISSDRWHVIDMAAVGSGGMSTVILNSDDGSVTNADVGTKYVQIQSTVGALPSTFILPNTADNGEQIILEVSDNYETRIQCASTDIKIFGIDSDTTIPAGLGSTFKTENQAIYTFTYNVAKSWWECIISGGVLDFIGKFGTNVDLDLAGGNVVISSGQPTGELSLSVQTSAMNMSSPSDLAIATKKYVDDNAVGGFDNTSLASYSAAGDIVLNANTAIGDQITLNATNFGGEVNINSYSALDVNVSNGLINFTSEDMLLGLTPSSSNASKIFFKNDGIDLGNYGYVSAAGDSTSAGIRLSSNTEQSFMDIRGDRIVMDSDSDVVIVSGGGSGQGKLSFLDLLNSQAGFVGAYSSSAGGIQISSNNSAHSLNITNSGGVSVSADPVNPLNVATKQYVDHGNMKAVTVTFASTDTTVNVGTAVPSNALVVSCKINITTAFDDVAATLTVGNSTTNDGISATVSSDPSTLGLYANDSLFDVLGNGQIQIFVSAGTATVGAGRVLVEYYIP